MTIRLLAEILLRSKLYFLNVSQSDKSRKNGDDVQRTKERAKLHFLVGMMLFVFWVEAVTTANWVGRPNQAKPASYKQNWTWLQE